jgi:hypothetical protein
LCRTLQNARAWPGYFMVEPTYEGAPTLLPRYR